jgi:hypothetical protein
LYDYDDAELTTSEKIYNHSRYLLNISPKDMSDNIEELGGKVVYK